MAAKKRDGTMGWYDRLQTDGAISPMTLDEHFEIVLAAMTCGLLSHDDAVGGLRQLTAMPTVPGMATFWIGEGLLAAEELRVVCRRLQTRRAQPISREFAPTLTPPPPVSGERYTVTQNIAIGGMGQVDECYDSELRRHVALKRLAAPARAHHRRTMFEAMIDREARLTASLEHPSIIPIYDASSDEAGRYYVMRLVNDRTLADVLDALLEGQSESYTTWRLLRDFVQVCRAVAYAHSRGVIHCDLKPSNILLGPFGEVLIVDWGLAYSDGDDFVPRGGTPGYMAPEQLDTAHAAFDARSDVFALGAILYEILCLAPPFTAGDDTSAIEVRFAHAQGRLALIPPRRRAPTRDIPEQLERVAMRAMALSPDERWQSVSELADTIETFLEGKEELERRQREADELTDSGDELAPRYHELVASRPLQLAELSLLRRELRPWDAPDDKQTLWAAEERVAITDALRVRTLHAAAGLYEQALELVPDHAKARRRLAQLYGSERALAEARRDDLAAIHFDELVRQYDDQQPGDGRDQGTLSLTGELCNVSAELTRLMTRERRLVAAGVTRDLALPTEVSLRRGSYLLTLRRDDSSLTIPIDVRSGASTDIILQDWWLDEVRADEVLVVAGDAPLGGDGDNAAWSQLQARFVDSFAIMRWPVTFAAYLTFVAAALADDEERAASLLPHNEAGEPCWRFADRRWLPSPSLTTASQGELLELPVSGIDVACAEAYAAWLSSTRGAHYRLPSDEEWEKAARGVDGRSYPWGDQFDASFCKMRDSRPGPPRPEAASVFALDESPYGVRAMAGTIAEWVSYPGKRERRFCTRGGSWADNELDCRLSSRRFCDASLRSSRVGMRLVRAVDGRDLTSIRPTTEA